MASKKSTFSLEQKMAELEAIEQYFQQPTMQLEQAIERHQQAILIAKEITQYLKDAKSNLEIVEGNN